MKPVLLITSGEYSDYSVVAIVNWLRDDVTPEQARDIYLAGRGATKDPDAYCGISAYDFTGWLNKEGYTQDLDAEELHVTDYGRLNEWSRKPFEYQVDD